MVIILAMDAFVACARTMTALETMYKGGPSFKDHVHCKTTLHKVKPFAFIIKCLQMHVGVLEIVIVTNIRM